MVRVLNVFLVIIFIMLVLLYSYKTLVNREVIAANIGVPLPVTPVVSTESNRFNLTENDVQRIVKEYIRNNPEDIIQSIENLQQKKLHQITKKQEDYLKNNKATIEEEGTPPTFGNNIGDVVIVLFYDYNCGFCQKANQYLEDIISNDTKIKVVLRPIPILGGNSLYLTKIALALHKIVPDKFQNIHKDLLNLKVKNEDSVKELIKHYEIDYDIVENEINSYSNKEIINKNFELAQNIEIKGAPSYIIGNKFIPGLLDSYKLKKIINEIRQVKN